MTSRRSLSVMQRLKIFEANKGICHLCSLKIVGKLWDVSHDRPLALLGEDGGDNLKVAHRACHKVQTVKDRARIDKAKQQAAKHLGIRKPATMQGSRNSRLKKHMDGRVTVR